MSRFERKKRRANAKDAGAPLQGPQDVFERDLIKSLDELIQQHASLDLATEKKDTALMEPLQKSIEDGGSKLPLALAEWRATRHGHIDTEEGSVDEVTATKDLLHVLDQELHKVHSGKAAEKWKKPNKESNYGPLQTAVASFSSAYDIHKMFKERVKPQWKPQRYTHMNEKVEGYEADYASDDDVYVSNTQYETEAMQVWKEIEEEKAKEEARERRLEARRAKLREYLPGSSDEEMGVDGLEYIGKRKRPNESPVPSQHGSSSGEKAGEGAKDEEDGPGEDMDEEY